MSGGYDKLMKATLILSFKKKTMKTRKNADLKYWPHSLRSPCAPLSSASFSPSQCNVHILCSQGCKQGQTLEGRLFTGTGIMYMQ